MSLMSAEYGTSVHFNDGLTTNQITPIVFTQTRRTQSQKSKSHSPNYLCAKKKKI